MFLNIPLDQFKNVFKQKNFSLPKRWSGKDFRSSVESLLKSYQKELQKIVDVMPYDKNYEEIAGICDGIVKSIESYFNGYPSEAFNQFSGVMETLMKNPLRIYLKTGNIGFSGSDGDPLKLYRVRNVHQNTTYSRSDIFHTPYNLRSKVATCRYSIVGYPSLYLGTSLELCGEESKVGTLRTCVQ